MTNEVEVDPSVAARARLSIERMLEDLATEELMDSTLPPHLIGEAVARALAEEDIGRGAAIYHGPR